MSEQNCSSCRFWKGDGDSPPVLGTCQRFPPVYTGRGHAGDSVQRRRMMDFDQPTTMASEWCGEYHERPVEAGQQAEQ